MMDERKDARTHTRTDGQTDGRTWATLNALRHSTNSGGIKYKAFKTDAEKLKETAMFWAIFGEGL